MVNFIEGSSRFESMMSLNDIINFVQVPLKMIIMRKVRENRYCLLYLVNLGQVMKLVDSVVFLVHRISDSE